MTELNFRTEKVSERITRIYAFSSELMYLVEGDNEAALIDSGSGIGFVRPLVEKLTDKPLKVLLTHGHVDHAMGASEFPAESVYISQE
ncbi:MAG: MBL fold metallo-hydrolase, partial [Lachnospiraceae bacterium]|nr:MBL fold metallo-hydrolase [Lachnospiraceae bacterium]